MATSSYQHKRGDSFDLLVTIPVAQYPDGYFSGYTVASQLRTVGANGAKIADLTCTWVNDLTTRELRLTCLDTTKWPIGSAQFDVQFTRISDGFVFSSATSTITIIYDVTRL